MKRLGTVLHNIDNLLIVRADKSFDPGILSPNSIVLTKRNKKIGTIKELFGPVSNPYVSIKLLKEITGLEIAELRNEKLYLR